MLGSHVIVVAPMRFLSRLDQRATNSDCEIVPGQMASSIDPKLQDSRRLRKHLALGLFGNWGRIDM